MYRYYLLPLEEVVPRERDREPRVARLLEIMEAKVCIGGRGRTTGRDREPQVARLLETMDAKVCMGGGRGGGRGQRRGGTQTSYQGDVIWD